MKTQLIMVLALLVMMAAASGSLSALESQRNAVNVDHALSYHQGVKRCDYVFSGFPFSKGLYYYLAEFKKNDQGEFVEAVKIRHASGLGPGILRKDEMTFTFLYDQTGKATTRTTSSTGSFKVDIEVLNKYNGFYTDGRVKGNHVVISDIATPNNVRTKDWDRIVSYIAVVIVPYDHFDEKLSHKPGTSPDRGDPATR